MTVIITLCLTCHGNKTAYEAEVGQMIGVDGGCRVDLQTVVTLARIFKQTVHRVQHLMRKKKEPLPENTHASFVRFAIISCVLYNITIQHMSIYVCIHVVAKKNN